MSGSIFFDQSIKVRDLVKAFFITAVFLALNMSLAGVPIILVALLVLYYRDRLVFFTVIFYTTIFWNFFYNDKTIEISNYYFKFFNLRYYGFELTNYYSIIMPVVLTIVFMISVTFTPLKKVKLFLVIVIFCFLLYVILQNIFIIGFDLSKIVAGFIKFMVFPMGTFIFITLKIPREELPFIPNKLSFLMGGFQGFIILTGSFMYIISPTIRYSGDLIVGTTSTSTNLVYLLSFAFLYHFSKLEFTKVKVILLLFIFVLIFLAQSGVQTVVLILLTAFAQIIRLAKHRNLSNFLVLVIPLTFIVFFLLLSPILFPSFEVQLDYAMRRINELIEFGILKNNKITVLQDIIDKGTMYENTNLIFGHGYGAFENNYLEKYKIQEFFNLSLFTTADTTFHNVLYDFGIVGLLLVFAPFTYFFLYFLKKYLQIGNEENLFGLSATLLILVCSCLISLGFDNYFISIVSIFIFGSILKINEKVG